MLQLFHVRLYQNPEVFWLDAKGDLSAAHIVVDLGNYMDLVLVSVIYNRRPFHFHP